MILVNTFVSVITLNVHRLTSQSKDIDWITKRTNKQKNRIQQYAAYKKTPFISKQHKQAENERTKKDILCKL